MTEPTIESLQAEVTRLKAHADDLLAERKAEKQRRETAENALATLQTAHDGLAAKLDDLTLTGPVTRALESSFIVPPPVARQALESAGFKFAIGKEGAPVALDGDKEVPLPELLRYVASRAATDLAWMLPRPSGTNAPGSTGIRAPSSQHKEQKEIKPAPQLGLR